MVRAVVLGALLLMALPTGARADQVDSWCSMPWWNMAWNCVALGPIAQGFAAAADAMDFVELDLSEGSFNSTGVQLAIVLHAGELGGPALATSTTVDLVDGADGFFRFGFEPPVPLTVDAPYVLEIVRVSDTGYAMVRGANDDPCPGIQGWISGTASSFADLWFQLGRSSEVETEASGWGPLKARYRRS